MSLNSKKQYPVWQLTDGTVVVQGQPENLEQRIVTKHLNIVPRMRHWLLKLLEKL